MANRPPPPAKPKRRVKPVDLAVFAAVLVAVAFVVYRVDFVLSYHWNWPLVFDFVMVWDEETGRLVPNLLLKGLWATIRLAFWGTILAAAIGLVIKPLPIPTL